MDAFPCCRLQVRKEPSTGNTGPILLARSVAPRNHRQEMFVRWGVSPIDPHTHTLWRYFSIDSQVSSAYCHDVSNRYRCYGMTYTHLPDSCSALHITLHAGPLQHDDAQVGQSLLLGRPEEASRSGADEGSQCAGVPE